MFETLVSFRSYKFAFTYDIEKMYRQISLDPRDRNLQCIYWRNSPENDVQLYRLCTVTYSIRPDSFLATNCLNVFNQEITESDPTVSFLIQKNVYMDDCLGGASLIDEVHSVQFRLHSILENAGIHLRKYASNCIELLHKLDNSSVESSKMIEERTKFIVSTLGIKWVPSADRSNFLQLLNV